MQQTVFVAYLSLIQFLVRLIACILSNLVLEHCKLLEEVVNRLLTVLVHRSLAVERHKLLYAIVACSQRNVAEEDKVEYQRSRKNRVAAEEIHLYCHRITHPTKNIDIIPTLLLVATRGIIVDAYLMINIGIEVGINVAVENILQSRDFAATLGFKVIRVIKYHTVTVSKYIGREPAGNP